MAIIETRVVDQQLDQHCRLTMAMLSRYASCCLILPLSNVFGINNPLLMLKTPQSHKTKQANQCEKKMGSRQSLSKDTDKSTSSAITQANISAALIKQTQRAART